MTQIDRRTFLSGAGAGGLTLLGLDGAASAARQLRSICPPGPPIPRRLQDAIRGRVFRRGSPGFSEAARIFNKNFDNVVPRLVARPVDTRDVRAALRWAIRHDVPFRARSGGHSYAGYSVLGGDGLVIDLRRLRQVSVNRRAGTVTVGAGAQLIDVHAALARHGGAVPGGSCPSVGIAGAAMGGGQGLTGRKFGLTSDNLIEAEIITADGCVQRVNRRSDPDLLWALRGGGGGNFGVVTRFTFRIHRVPSRAAYFNVRWPWSSANQAIDAWQRWAPRTNDGLTCILHLDAGGGGASINTSGQYLGPAGDLGRLLSPLLSVPGARVSTATYDYFTLQLIWAGCRHIGLLGCHNVPPRGCASARAIPGQVRLHHPPAVGGRPQHRDQRHPEPGPQPGRGCAPVRRLWRRAQPAGSARHSIRAPRLAVLHPVLHRIGGGLAPADPRRDAPVCIGAGLPELHRSGAE